MSSLPNSRVQKYHMGASGFKLSATSAEPWLAQRRCLLEAFETCVLGALKYALALAA
jgi:hypothetical protein